MFRKLFIAIGCAAAATGFGQMDGMSLPSADYMPAIFMNPSVAKDMHLSPEVVSKEQTVMMQQGMAMMPFLSQQNAHPSPEQRKKLMAAMFKAYKNMETASLAPLTASQKVRYHQLSLQYFGPMALAQAKVGSALGISPAQHKRLLSMLTSTSQGMAASIQGLSGGAGAGGNMMAKVGAMQSAQAKTRAAQERALKSILTPAQISKWNAMQGRKLPGLTNLFGGLGGR